MRAFAQAPMDAIERTLDWDRVGIWLNLAISTSILGVANTSSVVAPPSVAAIVRASLQTTIFTTKPRFTPAGSIQAKTVAGAIVQTNWDLAVRTMPLWAADARAIVALSVGKCATISTQFNGTIKVSPWVRAIATSVLANTVARALIGARSN